ncbi:hypothetical protein SEMRO_101_G051750.1 [Seminavis robusta]|uniref:Uncharacterized protein n=1 Tax=Seminavis robusta TaxID=568900 RepID=A0A9N8DIH4_9STRA|nr:hypothetical protein SEMRO_101_G051750.1 [Seminavis robusta]|eukprot:Sro101_g051750.1 n/a (364) ;mRNA; r:90479-91570
MVVASLLRHYDEFCSTLRADPEQRYQQLDRHLFVATVKEKLALVGATDDIFDAWKKEVKLGFFNRNLPALAIQNFPRHLGDVTNPFHQVVMDPRCFVDQFNAMATHYQALHSTLVQQQTTINNQTAMLQSVQRQLGAMEKMHENQTQLLMQLCRQSQVSIGDTPSTICPPTIPPVTPQQATEGDGSGSRGTGVQFTSSAKHFSVSVNSLGKNPTLADQFYFFFAERAKEGYQRDKEDPNPGDNRQLGNKFQRLKETVKFMLRFCGEFPRSPPGDPAALREWSAMLKSTASEAQKLIRQQLYPGQPQKEMLQAAVIGNKAKQIIKAQGLTDLHNDAYRTLPEMPEEMILWFGKDGQSNKRQKTS